MEASNLSKLRMGRSFPKVFERRACEGCRLKREIKFSKKFSEILGYKMELP